MPCPPEMPCPTANALSAGIVCRNRRLGRSDSGDPAVGSLKLFLSEPRAGCSSQSLVHPAYENTQPTKIFGLSYATGALLLPLKDLL